MAGKNALHELNRPFVEGLESRLLLNGTWTIQTLDDGASAIGAYSSLALDSAGEPHVSYYDNTAQDLMYIVRSAGVWSGPQTVRSDGEVGRFTSLAIDSNDNPHISYYNSTDSALMYVYWDGTDWQGQLVDDSADVGEYTSLALDGAGYAHIVYYDATNLTLKYAYWDGAGWQYDVIDTVGEISETADPGAVFGLASLEIDGTDKPHVSYYDGVNKQLKYAVLDGADWAIQTVDDSATDAGADNSLVLDSNNNPHISYHSFVVIGAKAFGGLNYAAWNGSEWDIQVVDQYQAAFNFTGRHTSIALDEAGFPHISYYDASASARNLRYARWDGLEWQRSTLDGLEYTGSYSSLAIDDGNAFISYHQHLATNKQLKFASAESIGTPISDLAVDITVVTATVWIPGDRVKVSVTVTNAGDNAVSGPITLELYSSDDRAVGDDDLRDTIQTNATLDGLESKDFQFQLTIPSDAAPEAFYLFVKLTAGGAIVEENLANNVVFSDEPNAVAWRFGTFDGRKNVKLTVQAGNVPVTFSLSGGGYGEIIGSDAFSEIILQGTTVKSAFTIATKGKNSETSFGNLVVNGPLRSIVAKTTDVRGNIYIEGLLGSLQMDDLIAPTTITINGGGGVIPARWTSTIRVDQAENTTLLMHGVPLRSLTATQWLGEPSRIEGSWLGTLSILGNKRAGLDGNFQGELVLDGTAGAKRTLNSANIKGSLTDSQWEITGNVGAVKIGGDVQGVDIVINSELGTFKAGKFADSDIQVSGPISSFQVGLWNDSDLHADSLRTLRAGDINRGRLDLAGKGVKANQYVLGSARVGNITDSADQPDELGWRIGGRVGTVSLGDADQWYFNAGGNLVRSITMGQVSGVQIQAADVLGTVKATSWNGGSLSADSINTLQMNGNRRLDLTGDLVGVTIALAGQNVTDRGLAARKIQARGKVDNVSAVINGGVNEILAGAIINSEILLGCQKLTGNISDFDDGLGGYNEYKLQSLRLIGYDPGLGSDVYFVVSQLGAFRIGAIRISKQDDTATGTVQTTELNRFINEPAGAGFEVVLI